MDLSIRKLSKAFNQKTVFTGLDFDLPSGAKLAIVGANGSGKSTLLKIISGGVLPSSGSILYSRNNERIPEDQLYQYVHFVAPYNTVIEELTLPELFSLHKKLNTLQEFDSYKDWVGQLAYKYNPDHRIKTFSSGMKQRVKLGLTLLDNRPLILLDEACSNMDQQGREWFFQAVKALPRLRTLILATNDPEERACCDEVLNIEDWSA
ncbi:MAG TPA: ATP-binding cassette domain-containing protein [Saprospiraceae bacterium]|nr:ATP-binding cassette domain-containing protein [Saprospiraceae bacterium]